MHRRAAIPLIAMLAISSIASADQTLIWSDEFDGTTLNANNWSYQLGDGSQYGLAGWGNNELQYYTSRPENIYVADGELHIVARQESFSGYNYTSARIRTENKADFLYGKIEARIRIPSTKGIWPAFWMLPTDSPLGGWASSGEIDIMESVNLADTIYGTIHYGGTWPQNTHSGGTRTAGIDYSQDFHVYTLEWTPGYLRWYVDGIAFYTRVASNWYSTAAPDDENAPFDHPFHVLLNIAVGGNFPGNPDGSSVFPQEMIVDWVRVYQDTPTQEPYSGQPQAIPGRVEMEDFDTGGQGIAYNDCTTANDGGAYRPLDSVDLEACNEGGFNIGWMCAGEWVEYTVNVADTGVYAVAARVASQQSNAAFRLEIDDVPVTADLSVPNTNGWQNWTTINDEATLDAGEHVLRFANAASAEFNINWIEFTPTCTPGDLNADGVVDGADITRFAAALANPQSAGIFELCAADVDQDGQIEITDDVVAFVNCLLSSTCP
ncbi:MAG TPA: family 16 glycosylhydrolase [Phycisphaerae bacterium]|nr:family 16 glycosylhydrolase [Phycisphaerae bacterium]HRW52689.1 family 16 glycosylhydrolase [Phycisphaerae bacterium]